MYDLEQSLIKTKLIIRQIYFGEQQAFGKKVIRYSDVLKKIFLLYQVFELFLTFGHKKQLERKSIEFWILVKLWEKGIISKLFEHKPCIEMPRQQMR